MIVRGYLNCGECGHTHVVRIGMGQSSTQRHRFACRNCHEEIEVGLDVDFAKIEWHLFYGSNAVESEARQEGSIVNLDANFLIPEEDQGKDLAFPRLVQSAKMVSRQIAARRAKGLPAMPSDDELASHRRPDFVAEWNVLRASWSLFRNGKNQLSERRVKEASDTYYRTEPLRDLPDWVWRFVAISSGNRHQAMFETAFHELGLAKGTQDFERFSKSFSDEISRSHSRIFLDLMRGYFAAFDEFAQVHFLIGSGADFPNAAAGSSNFDSVRMFYGNAFEALASVAEFLAYLNNLIAGRKFDEFASMTRETYLGLDKASRFRCFQANPAFNALASEADNVLRNASHHNGFVFDAKTQIITYRAGKGGQGAEQQLSYTHYLWRCSEIFLEAMVIFRLELVLANSARLRSPL